MSTRFLAFFWATALAVIALCASPAFSTEGEVQLQEGDTEGVVFPTARPWTTADHSSFPSLQQDFQSGPEVTETCLSCHNKAASQVQETIHWRWICPADPEGVMGKIGLTLNNF